MVDSFDVESLKVHKIAPKKGGKKRVHLPVAGALPQLDASDDIDEARIGEPRTRILGKADTEATIVETLKTIYDPEIPLNVYDLGLIYSVEALENGDAEIRMTLTAPACPVAGQIVKDVATKVGALDVVGSAHVKLVWDPPWTKDRMSDDALLELGLL